MSWESFVAALKENKPAILFSWSNKYENGKGRLITGADDFHFVLSSLCVHTLEECFYESELSGACLEPGDATANLLRFQELLRNGAVFLGADYVDYNIHESPEHQESMARAIVDVVRHYHQDADDVVIFALMAEWWVESFPNQYRSSDMPKLVQGLGSGVRINVVVLLRTHQGDDTNAMLSRVLDAVALYYGLSSLGMRLNAFKQLISREWAEYVRRVVTKDKLLAFTNRAIGNHLVPPVQMSEVADMLAKVAAWYGQINEISLRGAAPGAVDALHYNLLREATYERAVDRIPDVYLYTPVENQGYEFHTLGHIGMAFSQVELPRWPV
eukprot:3099856-Amphidinium_carterae.1